MDSMENMLMQDALHVMDGIGVDQPTVTLLKALEMCEEAEESTRKCLNKYHKSEVDKITSEHVKAINTCNSTAKKLKEECDELRKGPTFECLNELNWLRSEVYMLKSELNNQPSAGCSNCFSTTPQKGLICTACCEDVWRQSCEDKINKEPKVKEDLTTNHQPPSLPCSNCFAPIPQKEVTQDFICIACREADELPKVYIKAADNTFVFKDGCPVPVNLLQGVHYKMEGESYEDMLLRI